MKILKDLEKTTNPSIIRIARYLIDTAEGDSLKKESLSKENKSLDGMYAYVKSEAQKQAADGSACIEDAIVYSWAQHYYDEDSIDFEPKKVETKGKNTKPKVEEITLPEEDEDVFNF